MRRRRLFLLGLGVPAAVLALALLWLAFDHGTLALWNVRVHEGGRHTLGQTVLYYSHFVRELPIDVAMALFIAGAVDSCLGAGNGAPVVLRVRRKTARIAACVALILPVVALAATVATDGARSAFCDLLQCRTRDDEMGYGTHWRYHLLSTLWTGLAAPVGARLLLGVAGVPVRAPVRRSPLTLVAWGYVILLSLIFGVSAEVFTSVRYAGHQARELLTHAMVALPLTIALLLTLVRRRDLDDVAAVRAGTALALVRGHRANAVAATALAAYLAAVTLSGDVMTEGQSANGLAAMVGGHFFEHSLDYAMIPATSIVALVLARRRTLGVRARAWR